MAKELNNDLIMYSMTIILAADIERRPAPKTAGMCELPN